MLGQHPRMYSLPETHLFDASTMTKWWERCDASTFHMADGLLRAIAELFHGDQTNETIAAAEGWLRRRSHQTTGLVFEELIERASQKIVVESSSTLASRPVALRRIIGDFPLARFVQVTQHPRAFGERLMASIEQAAKQGPVPYWMLNLASFPCPSASDDGTPHQGPGFDPQRAWYELNLNVAKFLDTVSPDRKMTLRIEDLFEDARLALQGVALWLGVPTDDEALEAMMHPERSSFARMGPSRARFGNEKAFLQDPMFTPPQQETYRLDGPLKVEAGRTRISAKGPGAGNAVRLSVSAESCRIQTRL